MLFALWRDADVLSPAQIDELNAVYDERLRQARKASDVLTVHLRSDKSGSSFEDVPQVTDYRGYTYATRYSHFWSKAYMDLIDNPVVLPILKELLSNPAWGHCPPQVPKALRDRIRLDHDNVSWLNHDNIEAGGVSGANALHGGPGNWHITAAYELIDVPSGRGGLGVCPGSHMLDGWSRLNNMAGIDGETWRTQWCNSKSSHKHPNWDDESVPVKHLEAGAGDCIVFTEKLTHATVPWESKSSERRTVFYKYVPYGMHHGDAGYADEPGLTERQRAILEFPDSWFNDPPQPERQDYERQPWLTRKHPLAQKELDGPSPVRPGWCGPNNLGYSWGVHETVENWEKGGGRVRAKM